MSGPYAPGGIIPGPSGPEITVAPDECFYRPDNLGTCVRPDHHHDTALKET